MLDTKLDVANQIVDLILKRKNDLHEELMDLIRQRETFGISDNRCFEAIINTKSAQSDVVNRLYKDVVDLV